MRAVIKFFFLQGKAPKDIHAILTETLACLSRNCVIPVVCVRTLGSVGSQTQLSLRCNYVHYARDIAYIKFLSTPKAT